MQTGKKIAAVTGAGTGIGQTAAVALAQAGFSVALLGRRIDPLLATQEIIERVGGVAAAIPTDVSDEASVDASFAQIAHTFGRLDVLFNNAGRNAGAVPIDDYTCNSGTTWSRPT